MFGRKGQINLTGVVLAKILSIGNFDAPETKIEPVEVLIDRDPPVMTCDPTPSEIWPPNKSMVPVTVFVTAVDEVTGPADFWLAEINDSFINAYRSIENSVDNRN